MTTNETLQAAAEAARANLEIAYIRYAAKNTVEQWRAG